MGNACAHGAVKSAAANGDFTVKFEFSTASLSGADRFDYWRDVVCEHCIPAASETPHQSNFEASVAGRSVGSLDVATLIAPEHTWTRDAADVRRGPESSLWVSFMEAGFGYLEQNGKSVVQNAGDIVLYDAARPFKYNLSTESFYILRIPRDLLMHRTSVAEKYVATSLGVGTGFRPVLGSLIKEVSGSSALTEVPSAATHVTTSILDLLACLIDLHDGNDSHQSVNDALYKRACAFVQQHIGDPELSAQMVAASERISPRTLARVFAAKGTTPMRYIWQKRLEASYCAIAQGSVRKVSEAAMNFGFADLSHFSRTFKKTFGVSPQTLMIKKH